MTKLIRLCSFSLLTIALSSCGHHRNSQTEVVVRDGAYATIIEVVGAIDKSGADNLLRTLKRVEKNPPPVVLISLNSPGGELSGTLELAEAINRLSVPTIGYVKQGLGGTAFLMAAVDQLYFAPDGVCGAASVASIGARDAEADRMAQKLFAYLQPKLRALAEANGHDPEVFLAMINPDAELKNGATLLKRKGEVLSLTAADALTLGLSAGTAASPDHALAIHTATAR